MDLVSSLKCQKSDAQSVEMDKDSIQKDFFWPDIPCISDLSIRGNSIVIIKKGGGKVPCPPEMVPLDRDKSPLLKPGCPVGNKGEEPVEEKCEPPKSNLRVPMFPLQKSEPKADLDSTYIPFIQYSRPIGECKYCLKVGEHMTQRCPYQDRVPKNAILGSGCDVVCRVCGWFFRGSCCGQDEGRAVLKNCISVKRCLKS
ncbi:hypothetical protein L3X38_023073 [Prunus dulcis]|uniref:Uncharacterized protein n=1 Tax=Prunus dulcis TaxID=3755 RepID=A0AAD4VYU2_PRUDU|nr:hypothetical protein L3X38_023073 [Prunus dulcis]